MIGLIFFECDVEYREEHNRSGSHSQDVHSPMQILIVSHIGAQRRSLQLVLQGAGHLVQTSDSLEGAFSVLTRSLNVEVVISEWNLGSSSACELLGRLKQIPRLADADTEPREPSFIILNMPSLHTDHGGKTSSVTHMRSFGFRDILEKPVSRETLITKLKEIEAERYSLPTDAERGSDDSADCLPIVEATAVTAEPRPDVCPVPQSDRRLLELEREIRQLRAEIDEQQRRLTRMASEMGELTQR